MNETRFVVVLTVALAGCGGSEPVDSAPAWEQPLAEGDGSAGGVGGDEAGAEGAAPNSIDIGSLTAMQKHALFFDRNQNGTITLLESFKAMRALGYGPAFSMAAAITINGAVGPSTGEPAGTFLVSVENIAQAKHNSDTDIYDVDGNFDPVAFDDFFLDYDTDHDDAMNLDEIQRFFRRNKEEGADGTVASRLEFRVLLQLAGEDRDAGGETVRVITRDTLALFYDGSLLYEIAEEPVPF
jgi:peroxygenase